MYSGAGALIVGNGLKAGVRFLTYDSIKEVLRDENVSRMLQHLDDSDRIGSIDAIENNARWSGCRCRRGSCSCDAFRDDQVCTGSISMSTTDTCRTKLIQDAGSSRPMYTNMLNGTIGICRQEGFGGIYRGLAPTVGFARAEPLG